MLCASEIVFAVICANKGTSKYIGAYIIPSITDFISFFVLAISFVKIRNDVVKEDRWKWSNKCIITHIFLFSLLTLVLIIFFIVFLVYHLKHSLGLITFDYFFILYASTNFLVSGFMLILTWSLNKDHMIPEKAGEDESNLLQNQEVLNLRSEGDHLALNAESEAESPTLLIGR